MRLLTLKAKSVRGLPKNWPDLPIGEKGLVIYGPNGVGKSSIVDAIEFALLGKSSLFAENRTGVSWETASPHVHGGEPTIFVEVGHSGDKTDVNVSLNVPEKPATELAKWIAAAKKSSFVLRRYMLLAFIGKQPKDRYSILEPFLNLEEFSDFETALKSLVDGSTTSQNQIELSIQKLDAELRSLFVVPAGQELTECLLQSLLNETLRKVGLSPCQSADDVVARMIDVGELLGGKDQTDRLAQFGALKGQLLQLGSASQSCGLLSSLVITLQDLERELAATTEEVVTELLVMGQTALRNPAVKECPLCEQSIEREVLLERLNRRIAADTKITKAKQLVAERKLSLVTELTSIIQRFRAIIENWRAVLGVDLNKAYSETVDLVADLVNAVGVSGLKSGDLSPYLRLLESSVSDHTALLENVNTLITTEGGGDRRKFLTDAKSMLEGLAESWISYDLHRKKRQKHLDTHKAVESLHACAVESRKATVQQILDNVARTANTFYEEIHPNEEISSSKLSVRVATQKSIEMDTSFHGIESHPLRYLSESHLDTLGLCYFLAIREHEANLSSDFQCLILDDVMHSVDADHRNRVAQLLKKYFKNCQLIITTHDQYFYEMLRQQLGTGGYNYIKVTGWSISSGPVLSNPLTDLDKITNDQTRRLLSQDDLAAIGGRFFEWLLKEITESLQIAVPARFRRPHDIGNLWPATAKKLEKHVGFKQANGDLIEQLKANSWVRNACGAHHNNSPCAPTPSEVQEFGALLERLYSSLWCEHCRCWIVEQQDESWRCACSKLAYSKIDSVAPEVRKAGNL